MPDQQTKAPLAAVPMHATPCTQEPRIIALERTMTSIERDVHAIRGALLGDLGGHGGVCARLAEMETHTQALWKKVDDIASSIHGNGQPGINERLRLLESVQNRNSRLAWLLIAGIATQAAIIARQMIMGG